MNPPDHARLLSLAVHELRSPIGVVAGYLQMFLRLHGAALTDGQRKLLIEAEHSCGRLSALVAEMSDLAGLESGKAGAARRQVPLCEMLADVARVVQEGRDRGVTIELHGSETAAVVHADPDRLRDALAALLTSVLREHGQPAAVPVHCTVNRDPAGPPAAIVVMGGTSGDGADPARWSDFYPWRGGLGFRLLLARTTVERAGGRLSSLAGSDGRGAVRLELPLEPVPVTIVGQ